MLLSVVIIMILYGPVIPVLDIWMNQDSFNIILHAGPLHDITCSYLLPSSVDGPTCKHNYKSRPVMTWPNKIMVIQ